MTEKPLAGYLESMGLHHLPLTLAILFLVPLATLLAAAPGQESTAVPERSECVVLLHGLARTSGSMRGMAGALRAAGYRTVVVDYPSRQSDLETLAEDAVGRGIDACRDGSGAPIHLVTHSMGGILARTHFARHPPAADVRRLVMLGPPNRGSAVAGMLGRYRWFRRLLGPAALQLAPASEPRRQSPLPLPTGVIAGTLSSDPWFSPWLPGADDGKVSVAAAWLPGLADFARVAAGHSFLTRDPRSIRLTLDFLERGRFTPR